MAPFSISNDDWQDDPAQPHNWLHMVSPPGLKESGIFISFPPAPSPPSWPEPTAALASGWSRSITCINTGATGQRLRLESVRVKKLADASPMLVYVARCLYSAWGVLECQRRAFSLVWFCYLPLPSPPGRTRHASHFRPSRTKRTTTRRLPSSFGEREFRQEWSRPTAVSRVFRLTSIGRPEHHRRRRERAVDHAWIQPTATRWSIGWRQFNSVTSNFRQAGWGYTTNGGTSWTFPGVLENNVFRSDPVLHFDDTGRFFYNSLLGDFFDDSGGRSTAGRPTTRLGPATGGDKQWITIDNTNSTGHGFQYQAGAPPATIGAAGNSAVPPTAGLPG